MPDTIHAYAPLWGVWHIQEALTEGSWGPIYKIFRDAGGKRAYALAACVFVPGDASKVYDSDVKRGVLLELGDLQALNGSPNIVRLDEFSMHARQDGEGYDLILRMEYLLSFVQYKSANALTRKDSLVLGLHICYALNQCGGVHGDIRPENIFLAPDGNYKLACFPLAFQKTGRKGAPAHTLLYASPELYKGAALHRSADVYSLGLLLYSLLNSDRPPLLEAGGSLDRAVRLRLKGRDFPPPESVDVRLASALVQATAHDPLDRFITADDLEKALRPCILSGAGPTARAQNQDIRRAIATPAKKKAKPLPFVLAAVIILCAGAGIFLLGGGGGGGAQASPKATPPALTALFSHSPAPHEGGAPEEEAAALPPSASPDPDHTALPSFHQADTQAGLPRFIPDQPIVNRRGNSAGNLANGGIVAHQGEWIYFAAYGGGIYKLGPKMDAPVPVIEEYEAAHLNITGNYLYFRNLTKGACIYRVRTDGVAPEALTDTGAAYLFVEDGTLYYTDQERASLYRMEADGSANTLLSADECLSVNVEDGWIYYRNGSEGDSLYSMRTDGSERARVSGDRSAYLAVSQGWAFYNNVARHDYLFKIKADGTGKARVNNDNTAHINAAGGFVYYACLNKSGALYRVGVNGGSKSALSADDSIAIQIAGDWVYYRNRSDGYALYRVRTDGSGKEVLQKSDLEESDRGSLSSRSLF